MSQFHQDPVLNQDNISLIADNESLGFDQKVQLIKDEHIDVVDKLLKMKELMDCGLLSKKEFEQIKQELLK